MEILVKVVQFFLSLTLLVTVHEFGHFIFAKLFKVTVLEFSIGMGPAIFTTDPKKKKKRQNKVLVDEIQPDNSDIEELNDFAIKILKKLNRNADTTLTLPGNRPYKVFPGSSVRPLTNDSCVKCKLCTWQCPVEAISENTPNITDTGKCISCMRCLSVCPNYNV